jgi:small-conductance mechanosensitive channel
MDRQELTRLLRENAELLLDRTLFEISGTPITIATLVMFALIVLATMWISWLVQRFVVKAMRLRGVEHLGSIGVTKRLVHYFILLTGISIGLQTIGINIAALFAAGAIFAIGVGFAMRNLAENFVSGVILLVERSIKPQDVLKVDDRVVRVVRMGIRATIVRTRDDEEIIVPNTLLVQNNVTNYTLRDSFYRLRTIVGVTYDSDMQQTLEVLEKTAAAIEWRIPEREPRVLLREFGNSSVNFDVSVWVTDPWRAIVLTSELNQAIWWALKDAGIVIAFPQLDLHVKEPVAVLRS